MRLNLLTSIARSKPIQKFEEWALKETPSKSNPAKKVTNYSKLQKIYPPLGALFAGIVQGACLYSSKDMPKERKLPLVLNIANNDIIALIGGALISKRVDKFLDKMEDRAKVIYYKDPKKLIYLNGIKTAIPFFISAVLFKYIGPVLATPLADKTNKILVKKGLIHYDNKKT